MVNKIKKMIPREIFGHFTSALGRRCAGKSVASVIFSNWKNFLFFAKVDLIAGHIVALFHALFLSSCLGSIATEVPILYCSFPLISLVFSQEVINLDQHQVSTYILLGIDFIINLLFTGQVNFC